MYGLFGWFGIKLGVFPGIRGCWRAWGFKGFGMSYGLWVGGLNALSGLSGLAFGRKIYTETTHAAILCNGE